MLKVRLAAVQMSCSDERAANLATAERLVRQAASAGAQIIVLPELFETPYFCKDHDPRYFDWALPLAENPAVRRLQHVAQELQVVLPVSVFERDGQRFFNSVVLIDADGSVLGCYRKSHIPESPGYHEKFYFTPGDTGFKVWPTRYGMLGVGICWDQWFPECARAMALLGAELLIYPTAIGAEPQDPSMDSQPHWQRTMQGHAAANVMPVLAANRVGTEQGSHWTVTYYGSSFVTDHTGLLLAQAPRDGETIVQADIDLQACREYRRAWGVFRDRRPDLYGALTQ